MIKSQFDYCPLVRMFCSRKSNNFRALLYQINETSVHQKTLQFLKTEICKIENNYTPPIMHHLFQCRENTFNLRNFREIATHKKKTSNYGLEIVSYTAPFLWSKLPSE